MTLIEDYTNNMLYQEKSLVTQYFLKRSVLKNYPHSYQMGMLSLIDKIYDVCVLKSNSEKLHHPLVQKALVFATNAHQHQQRKFIDLSYIIHPVEMAARLSGIEHIEIEQIVAALLHDVVEDCNISLKQVEESFGTQVTIYVNELTDPAKPEDGNREVRMNKNFTHFLNSSLKSKEIKIADLLSNTRSIVICDANFCAFYVPSITKAYEHLKINHISPQLMKQFEETITLSHQIMNLQKSFSIIKKDKKK